MADEVYQPSTSLQERAFINSMEAYHAEHERSIADPEAFWAEKAEEFHCFKKRTRSALGLLIHMAHIDQVV